MTSAQAAASERYCDSPLLILSVHGEKAPDKDFTPAYMLKNILGWHVPLAFKQTPGVEEAIDEFLAKMAVMMKDHPGKFNERHHLVVSFHISIKHVLSLMYLQNSESEEDRILKYLPVCFTICARHY